MRFVMLEHIVGGHAHIDLLFESGLKGLRTWRLERMPDRSSQTALSLPDHRRIYLDYQGPVHPSRGYVRRKESGTYRLLVDSLENYRSILDGEQRQGVVELTKNRQDLEESVWSCRWFASEGISRWVAP